MTNVSILAPFKAHTCPRCRTAYLLFKKGALCPNCKYEETTLSAENLDFINALLEVMIAHKRKYNRYTPDSWFVNDVSDTVSNICFQIFDRLESEKEGDEQTNLKKILDEMNWRNKGHLKIHVREIINDLYKTYLQKKPRHTFFSKIRSVFIS